MPSGYKLVITRALGMHGIYCTQPHASVQYMPYIPRARVITITNYTSQTNNAIFIDSEQPSQPTCK